MILIVAGAPLWDITAGEEAMFKYEVDMRVCGREERDGKGTIVYVEGPDGYQEVKVIWDGFEDEGPRWAETMEIMPDTPEAALALEEQDKKTQAKIDEATSLLDQAFKAWFEAAGLQAGRDVGNSEAYFLRGNPNLDLSKFEKVVEENGWSTSSLYC